MNAIFLRESSAPFPRLTWNSLGKWTGRNRMIFPAFRYIYMVIWTWPSWDCTSASDTIKLESIGRLLTAWEEAGCHCNVDGFCADFLAHLRSSPLGWFHRWPHQTLCQERLTVRGLSRCGNLFSSTNHSRAFSVNVPSKRMTDNSMSPFLSFSLHWDVPVYSGEIFGRNTGGRFAVKSTEFGSYNF